MILGVGTDITEVARFKTWVAYPHVRLLKIFSLQELSDCQNDGQLLIPEKLAARFAAKEAFYKALSATLVALQKTEKTFSFLSIAFLVRVSYAQWGVPKLVIDWVALSKIINSDLPPLQVHLSLTHEKSYALAFVVIAS
jgi:holo-[acyl-carrier protein] synthase